MKWTRIRNSIEQKENIPVKGYIIAYTRKKVIFQKFGSIEELDKLFGLKEDAVKQEMEDSLSDEILEIHLFDGKREYRAISSDSKRDIVTKDLCAIEHLADFDIENKDEVYEEKIMIEPVFKKPENGITNDFIIVYNHISYDEQGMAKVDDYRLAMEG